MLSKETRFEGKFVSFLFLFLEICDTRLFKNNPYTRQQFSRNNVFFLILFPHQTYKKNQTIMRRLQTVACQTASPSSLASPWEGGKYRLPFSP